jgi:hypothetical protein
MKSLYILIAVASFSLATSSYALTVNVRPFSQSQIKKIDPVKEKYIYDIIVKDKSYESYRQNGAVLLRETTESTLNKDFADVNHNAIYKVFDSSNKYLKKVLTLTAIDKINNISSLKVRVISPSGIYTDIPLEEVIQVSLEHDDDHQKFKDYKILFKPSNLQDNSYIEISIHIKCLLDQFYVQNVFLGSVFPLMYRNFSINYSDDVYLKYYLKDNSRNIKITSAKENGHNKLKFNAANLPAFDASHYEKWNRAAPFITITTLKSWGDFAAWYAKNVKADHYKLNNKMIDLVENIKKEGSDDQEVLAERLYDWVRKNIVYKERNGFEISPAISEPAVTVFERKNGDCKNVSTLLIALLSYAGIDAYPVLVSTSKNPFVLLDYPFVKMLDHAIVAVRLGHNLVFLDCTDEKGNNDFELLPRALRKRPAIILYSGTSYKTITTPEYTSKIMVVEDDIGNKN